MPQQGRLFPRLCTAQPASAGHRHVRTAGSDTSTRVPRCYQHAAAFSVAAPSGKTVASTCWNCNEAFAGDCGSRTPMFCGKCGSIQPADMDGDLFHLFGMTRQFDLEPSVLEARYKQLMVQLHPDKFMQKNDEEQAYSSAQSSIVNDGYSTLKYPHARAVYMLKFFGIDLDESPSDFGGNNIDFMMEVMEASSEIEDAGADQDKLRRIRESFYLPHLSEACAAATAAFHKEDVAAATDATAKLQYLKRLGDLLGDSIDVQ
eukprot:Tamp_24259.p1 GENE.Tamp_24259~~Tamp_24259.p1  ORF type:complete len:296 (-),score=36.06 Tamp_24259:111-890(-)